jgi:hypothetical protein
MKKAHCLRPPPSKQVIIDEEPIAQYAISP